MTVPNVLWSGLIVVDRFDRAVIWQGSHTPKLYRSEEQGRYSIAEDQRLVPVELVLLHGGAGVEPARERPEGSPRRIYEARECQNSTCRKMFEPTGPHHEFCGKCEPMKRRRSA